MPHEQATFDTPFGCALEVRCERGAIVAAEFVRARVRRAAAPRDPLLSEARAQVQAYLRKRLRRFDLPLRLSGTDFQVRVWEFTAGLETGEIVSYGDLARAIGAPRAARAVAAAMARTPIDLFIPAHRVVGSDGTVRGAGAGSMRRKLLAFEGITFSSR